ncbi:hypothetical protein B5X24_HaOG208263 [Helicoverpa armigera]|uniref:Uncharacterized protein n=1 Tax=Helicoverpa armigera TaxID=29058 RepID=A0A2W1BIK8_HELAM|nr:hypothetical protein B5X24_HaOG208263 [Helicoverpa armigera]
MAALPQSDTGDRGAGTSTCEPQLQQNGVSRVLDNDRYLVKKVVGHHGRPRKVAHDQLRRAPQPGGSPQAAVSPPADDHQPGPSSDGTSVASQPLTTSHVSPPLDEQQ